MTREVRLCIEILICQEPSPQQAADYLENHKGVRLHHETIYKMTDQDKAQGGDLYLSLKIASKPYRKCYRHYDRRGKIRSRTCIE